jgi:DNA polymerase III subunit alpha
VENEAWHGHHSAQLSLLTLFTPPPAAPSLAQRAAWEHELLGYHVSVHPLDLYADRLAEAGAVSSKQIGQHLDRSITLGGLRVSYHHVSSTAKDAMLLVDMEDQAGLYQVLWSGAALRQARALINQREPVLIRGRVRRDRRGLILIVGSEIELLAD